MSYNSNKNLGTYGNKLFETNYAYITHENGLPYAAQGNIEGADDYALAFTNGVKTNIIEVKTINSFLERDNDGNDESGTLQFELWGTTSNTTHGWLYAYEHPDEYAAEKCINTKKHVEAQSSDAIVFILCYHDRAFASIMFKDYHQLYARLKELSPWDLTSWNLPDASNSNYWIANPKQKRLGQTFSYQLKNRNGESIEGQTRVIYNVWYVPFSALQDLDVAVTIIGPQPPVIFWKDLAYERYKLLSKLSNGWTFNPEKEEKNRNKLKKSMGLTANIYPVDVQALEKNSDPELLESLPSWVVKT